MTSTVRFEDAIPIRDRAESKKSNETVTKAPYNPYLARPAGVGRALRAPD